MMLLMDYCIVDFTHQSLMRSRDEYIILMVYLESHFTISYSIYIEENWAREFLHFNISSGQEGL